MLLFDRGSVISMSNVFIIVTCLRNGLRVGSRGRGGRVGRGDIVARVAQQVRDKKERLS